MGFNGEINTILIKDIDTIFTYGQKVNPFSQFDLTNESYQYLKDVYFDADQNQPDLSGWAINFIEDLIFFYSLEGKMYVLSINQIGKIRAYNKTRKRVPVDFKPVRLEVSDYLAKCEFPETTASSEVLLRPVRILSDQIKIGQFLSNFKQGKHDLDNFQERTYLYAKPYLFPKRNRLSIPYYRNNFGLKTPIPFAFIWSTGRDYHFQSNNGIGAQTSENLPNLQSTFLLRSDFKSHFLSGSFEGNLTGLSAGLYTEESFTNDIDNVLVPEDVEFQDPYKPYAAESFNYLAIMGADYGPFSVGVGSYFPVFRISFSPFQTREILAFKMTPLARFIYTKKNYKIRLIGAQTKYSINKETLSEQLVINGTFFEEITGYQFVSRYVRLGGEIDVYIDVKIIGDIVYSKGNYSETIDSVSNNLAYKNTTFSIGIEHAFSHYVNLKLVYQKIKRVNTGRFNTVTIDETESLSTFGGHFELLF